MFISTVRTNYLLEDLGKLNISEIDDSIDLGFLTDRCLLNAILTRTRYLVCVVGDPTALCTIGKCAPIWKRYIDRCDELWNGTCPKNWTLKDIEFHIQTFMESSNSRHCYTTEIENDAEADDILQQLANEASKLCYAPESMQKSTKTATSSSHIKYINVKENRGHAVPFIDDVQKHTIESREHEMIEDQPDRYKRCTLLISSAMKIRAKVKNPTDSVTEIAIGSRRRCGQAFNNDEVCVEILSAGEDENDHIQVPEGQVVAIIRRALDLKYRKFVCTVDISNPGMMIPLNRGIPKMANVAAEKRLGTARPKGTVCLYEKNTGKTKFSGYEPASFPDGTHKLFVVQFLKWQKDYHTPLCIAVEVLPPGNTMESGLKILNIDHFITRNLEGEKKNRHPYKRQYGNRKDIRHIMTFTIDPNGSKDLDDALSVENLSGGRLQIGIHITDVSDVVEKGGTRDKGAKSRGMSMYPVCSAAIPMLPETIAYDHCSLMKHKDRNTISVFFTVTEAQSQYIMEAPSMNLTVINSNHQLHYEEAERILGSPTPPDLDADEVSRDLHKPLRLLSQVTMAWRKARLGDAAHCLDLDTEAAKTPRAHILVEELMIAANKHVAEILLDSYPHCVPLRAQLPPGELELTAWRQEYASIAKETFDLKQSYLPCGSLCRCSPSCTCLPPSENSQKINLSKLVWNKSMHDIEVNSDEYIPFAATSTELLLEAVVARNQLRRIQEKSMYVCSGEYRKEMSSHYTLNMLAYTHFTSPLRRYVDIVVHRLLIARMKGHACPYTRSEVSEICTKCTESSKRSKDYETSTARLYLATILQNNPATLQPVVEAVNESNVQLRWVL